MALINNVLEGGDGFAIAYMDDILIYRPNEKTHLKHLKIILKKLKKARWKIRISKCNFLKKNLHYLGHLLSADGILPMKEKTAAIRELVPPTNVHEIQQVMGMFNYYRKFIPNFSEIAKGIVQLTKKEVKFEWTPERQVAFETLKDYLTRSPILISPNPNKEYYLFTGA